MNRIAKAYIEELQQFYTNYLKQEESKLEKTYNMRLSELYELAFDLVPEEAAISLRDEGKQKMRTLSYLKGECDALDQRGDMYPAELKCIKVNDIKEDQSHEFNIIGVISEGGCFTSIKQVQSLELQNKLKENGALIKSPYHKLYFDRSATLLFCDCWRYLVTEDKYREFFKYIIYEHVCKDLGGEADSMYIGRLERLKNEIKTNYMMRVEEYKDRNIVSLNYFRHSRGKV